MENTIKYSWEEYYSLINQLAEKVKPQIDEYDQLLCLARGGLFLGDAFSRIFNLPLAIMFTSSYKNDNQQGELFIDKNIAKQTPVLGKKILLLDDMVDSGKTIIKIHNHLQTSLNLEKLSTAVIWKKEYSIFDPDYYVFDISDEWIIQPFEEF